jgi:hypothetical protein
VSHRSPGRDNRPSSALFARRNAAPMMHGASTAADLDHGRGWLLEGASHFSKLWGVIRRTVCGRCTLFAHEIKLRPAEHPSRTCVAKYAPPPRQRARQVTSLRVPRDNTRRALVPCVQYDRTSHEPRFRRVRPSFSSGDDAPLSGCTIAAGIQQQLYGTPDSEYRDIWHWELSRACPEQGLPHHPGEWTCRQHRSRWGCVRTRTAMPPAKNTLV